MLKFSLGFSWRRNFLSMEKNLFSFSFHVILSVPPFLLIIHSLSLSLSIWLSLYFPFSSILTQISPLHSPISFTLNLSLIVPLETYVLITRSLLSLGKLSTYTRTFCCVCFLQFIKFFPCLTWEIPLKVVCQSTTCFPPISSQFKRKCSSYSLWRKATLFPCNFI